MTDEFEQALHRALRKQDPAEDFFARVEARLDRSDGSPLPAAHRDSLRHRVFRSRWLPAALAASVIAAVSLVQVRQHALDAARANQARDQLLRALSIASDNINAVRAAVAREENPNS